MSTTRGLSKANAFRHHRYFRLAGILGLTEAPRVLNALRRLLIISLRDPASRKRSDLSGDSAAAE
jgi:hypothetical protein